MFVITRGYFYGWFSSKPAMFDHMEYKPAKEDYWWLLTSYQQGCTSKYVVVNSQMFEPYTWSFKFWPTLRSFLRDFKGAKMRNKVQAGFKNASRPMNEVK